MQALKEFLNFFIFLFLLIFFSTLFTFSREEDRAYSFGDSTVSEDYLKKEKASLITEYLKSIHSIFTLNLGKTTTGEDILKHLYTKFIPSLEIAVFSILWSSLLAFFLGLYSSYSHPFIGKILEAISNFILSTPIFIVSVVLFILFFLELGVFPPGGYIQGDLSYLILPSLSLGSRVFARIYLLVSLEANKEKDSPYILFLKSRGFPETTIYLKYISVKILPVALIFILLDFSSLLSGAIVVEEIFFFPGIGRSLYYAIRNLDQNLLRVLLIYSGILFYASTRIARVIQEKISGSNQ